MLRNFALTLLIVLSLASTTHAADVETQAYSAAKVPVGAASDLETTSEADRIASLKKALADDETRLAELQATLEGLNVDFTRQSDEFSRLDTTLSQLKDETNSEVDADEVAVLTKRRGEWKQTFDRTIATRKAVAEQIKTVTTKVDLLRGALDTMQGVETQPELSKPALPTIDQPVTSAPTEANEIQVATSPPAPSVRVIDSKVDEARRTLEEKTLAQESAETKTTKIREALELFQSDLAGEKQLLELAKQNNQATIFSGNPVANPQAVAKHQQRVDELTQQLVALESAKVLAEEELQAAAAEVDDATRWLRLMESPIAPHRMLDWALTKAPRILATLFLLMLVWWVLRFAGRRIVRGVISRSRAGSQLERDEQSQTLVGVLNSMITLAVLIVGAMTVLDQAGIDVTVLLGGAAVFGMAIAFGAQNLIRDYFYGSMILAENQYRVGNVVRIAGISGLVQNITLRMTTLRDLDGVVHFVPHGEIKTVSNLTQGWSRVVFDIGVAYGEDVDRVMEVLSQLCEELRHDPGFQSLIIEDAEMLGVDEFADSAVVIKFMMKTRPLKQWPVKREMLRRIKNRFDELGIEIPYPHRTVYHRYEEGHQPIQAQALTRPRRVGSTA